MTRGKIIDITHMLILADNHPLQVIRIGYSIICIITVNDVKSGKNGDIKEQIMIFKEKWTNLKIKNKKNRI